MDLQIKNFSDWGIFNYYMDKGYSITMEIHKEKLKYTLILISLIKNNEVVYQNEYKEIISYEKFLHEYNVIRRKEKIKLLD